MLKRTGEHRRQCSMAYQGSQRKARMCLRPILIRQPDSDVVIHPAYIRAGQTKIAKRGLSRPAAAKSETEERHRDGSAYRVSAAAIAAGDLPNSKRVMNHALRWPLLALTKSQP